MWIKRLAFLLILFPSVSMGAFISDFFDGSSTNTVTLTAPGAGKQNCFTNVSFDVSTYGANSATFRMLDSQTTNYQLVMSTTAGFTATPSAVVMSFTDQNPWCGGMNNQVIVKNSATAYDINYHGYIKSNNP